MFETFLSEFGILSSGVVLETVIWLVGISLFAKEGVLEYCTVA